MSGPRAPRGYRSRGFRTYVQAEQRLLAVVRPPSRFLGLFNIYWVMSGSVVTNAYVTWLGKVLALLKLTRLYRASLKGSPTMEGDRG